MPARCAAQCVAAPGPWLFAESNCSFLLVGVSEVQLGVATQRTVNDWVVAQLREGRGLQPVPEDIRASRPGFLCASSLERWRLASDVPLCSSCRRWVRAHQPKNRGIATRTMNALARRYERVELAQQASDREFLETPNVHGVDQPLGPLSCSPRSAA